MIHLDFSDFELIVDDARPSLPGIFDAEIRRVTAQVLGEFTERAPVFIEDIQAAAGESFYELISPHDCTMVIGIKTVEVGGVRVLPGDYRSHAVGQIEFSEPTAASVNVFAVLKTLESACGFPTVLMQRWRRVICDGVLARLMLQPGKQWSNPELGMLHRQAFEQGIQQACGDARNEHSVTRQTRPHYNRSVWS